MTIFLDVTEADERFGLDAPVVVVDVWATAFGVTFDVFLGTRGSFDSPNMVMGVLPA